MKALRPKYLTRSGRVVYGGGGITPDIYIPRDTLIKNETYNNFWKSADLTDKYNKINVPAYFITGWYDNLVHETFKNFIGWKTKTKNKIAKEKTKSVSYTHLTLPTNREV